MSAVGVDINDALICLKLLERSHSLAVVRLVQRGKTLLAEFRRPLLSRLLIDTLPAVVPIGKEVREEPRVRAWIPDHLIAINRDAWKRRVRELAIEGHE